MCWPQSGRRPARSASLRCFVGPHIKNVSFISLFSLARTQQADRHSGDPKGQSCPAGEQKKYLCEITKWMKSSAPRQPMAALWLTQVRTSLHFFVFCWGQDWVSLTAVAAAISWSCPVNKNIRNERWRLAHGPQSQHPLTEKEQVKGTYGCWDWSEASAQRTEKHKLGLSLSLNLGPS